MGRVESEVNLYCRKVLIQAQAKGLFPEWLRFLKGVVDSEDLPLNISRETMQDTRADAEAEQGADRALPEVPRRTGREGRRSATRSSTREYQRFLKEGVVTDFTHKEALGKLLRYESSATEKGKITSLADYVKRMPSRSKRRSITCWRPNREAAESSPYFEVFRERKFEVLFLYDPWDEFVMEHLRDVRRQDRCAPRKRRTSNLSEGRSDGALVRGCGESRSPSGSRKRSATRSAKCACRSASWTAPRWSWTRTSS